MGGTQVSQIILKWSLSSAVSSFLSRAVGFKFCIKNEKTSTTKFTFSTSSAMYLLYEMFVNKVLDFSFVLLYFVLAFFFFSEWCYHPERNVGLADFLAVVIPPIVCSEVSSCPRFLPPPWNSGCFETVPSFENLLYAPSSFKVFSTSNVSSLPWTWLILK